MIKLEELRIGNWVYFKDPARNISTPIQINYIDQYNHLVGYKSESGDIFCEQKYIEPIVLTEEKLINCGFKSMEYPAVNGGTLLGYGIDGYKHFILKYDPLDPTYFIEYNFEQPIKSLHQLQNIIFDVYGKELNVQL